jgi:hypothetical protein
VCLSIEEATFPDTSARAPSYFMKILQLFGIKSIFVKSVIIYFDSLLNVLFFALFLLTIYAYI